MFTQSTTSKKADILHIFLHAALKPNSGRFHFFVTPTQFLSSYLIYKKFTFAERLRVYIHGL